MSALAQNLRVDDDTKIMRINMRLAGVERSEGVEVPWLRFRNKLVQMATKVHSEVKDGTRQPRRQLHEDWVSPATLYGELNEAGADFDRTIVYRGHEKPPFDTVDAATVLSFTPNIAAAYALDWIVVNVKHFRSIYLFVDEDGVLVDTMIPTNLHDNGTTDLYLSDLRLVPSIHFPSGSWPWPLPVVYPELFEDLVHDKGLILNASTEVSSQTLAGNLFKKHAELFETLMSMPIRW